MIRPAFALHRGSGRAIAAAGVLAAVAAVLSQVHIARSGWSLPGAQHWVDLDIYLASARTYAQTGRLYCLEQCPALGFTYPPVAVLPILALTALPAWGAQSLVTAATLLAAVAVTVMVLRADATARAWMPRAGVPWAVAAVTFSEPVRMSVGQGQLSVIVAALAIAGVLASRPPTGALLAVSAALKLTPVVLLAPSLVSRAGTERRRVGWALATGVVLALASLLLGPRLNWDYVTRVLPDTSRVGPLDSLSNTSIAGLFAHWGSSDALATGMSFAVGAALLAAVLVRARRADLTRPAVRVHAALAAGLVTLVMTPISWTHHGLYAPLAAALAIRWGARTVGALCLVVWELPLMHIAVDHAAYPLTAVLQSLRPLSLVVLLVLLLTRLTPLAAPHTSASASAGPAAPAPLSPAPLSPAGPAPAGPAPAARP